MDTTVSNFPAADGSGPHSGNTPVEKRVAGLTGRRLYENVQQAASLSRSVIQEREAMVAKLAGEISQLERWMDAQSRNERIRTHLGNVSLVPTIRALIETRRKLLRSLEDSL